MFRLPKPFETEVLSKHNIYWEDVLIAIPCQCGNSTDDKINCGRYKYEDFDESRFINKYELAAYGIEELKNEGYTIGLNEIYWNEPDYYNNRMNKIIIASFEGDFCNTVFKAINEVYIE